MNIEIVDEPVWIDFQTAQSILAHIAERPTWWLKNGIDFKYIDIRMDARTGDMLIKSDHTFTETIKYLKLGE